MPAHATATPQRGRPPIIGLRNAILRNAEAFFTGRDFHAVAMGDIARRCGVGKGTLYRYFASKEALFHSVMREGLVELQAQIAAAATAGTDPAARLASVVRSILRHFAQRPGLAELIDREERKRGAAAQRWFGRRAELARLIADLLREGIAAGDFRPVEPRLAAEMLLGMLRAMNRYRGAGDPIELVEAAVLGGFLDGILARGGGDREAGAQRARQRSGSTRRAGDAQRRSRPRA